MVDAAHVESLNELLVSHHVLVATLTLLETYVALATIRKSIRVGDEQYPR